MSNSRPGRPLDILVEAMGRINFGPQLAIDRKGIVGKVTLNGEELKDWEHYSLPLTDPGNWPFARKPAAGPSLYRGSSIWIRCRRHFPRPARLGQGPGLDQRPQPRPLLAVGPQQTLFVPAPWLKQGANEAIVLDLFEAQTRTLESHTGPIYDTPA